MTKQTNILILSCGTRNKIVQYFKKELENSGKVLATDCSELAPALYDADKYFIVPRMDQPGYIEVILKICKEHNVTGVLSLIDPELSLLAQNRQDFLDIGVTPIISDYNVIESCFDKYRFYEFLVANGFKTIKSFVDKKVFYEAVEMGIISYPVFVKPVRGSASINISKVYSKEEIELLFGRYNNLLIQEFIDGVEYGVDAYIDLLSGETVAIFAKEKIKMRAGETDKSVSYKDVRLFELVDKFVRVAGFKGVIDIDVFKVNDEYIISEVNPRFGGGYPHAYECGVNIPALINNNLVGVSNINEIGHYEDDVYMLKYNEIKILRKFIK